MEIHSPRLTSWDIIAFIIDSTRLYKLKLTESTSPRDLYETNSNSTEIKLSKLICAGKFRVTVGNNLNARDAYEIAAVEFLRQIDQNNFLDRGARAVIGFGLSVVQDYDERFLEKTLYIRIKNIKSELGGYFVHKCVNIATNDNSILNGGSTFEFFKNKINHAENVFTLATIGGIGAAAGTAYLVNNGGNLPDLDLDHEVFQDGGLLDIGGIQKRDKINRKKAEISVGRRQIRMRQDREDHFARLQGQLNSRDFIKSDDSNMTLNESWNPRVSLGRDTIQTMPRRAEMVAFATNPPISTTLTPNKNHRDNNKTQAQQSWGKRPSTASKKKSPVEYKDGDGGSTNDKEYGHEDASGSNFVSIGPPIEKTKHKNSDPSSNKAADADQTYSSFRIGGNFASIGSPIEKTKHMRRRGGRPTKHKNSDPSSRKAADVDQTYSSFGDGNFTEPFSMGGESGSTGEFGNADSNESFNIDESAEMF